MDELAAGSSVLATAIVEWLAGEALLDTEPSALFGELCRRIRAVGVPVIRSQVNFRTLHPLYDATAMTWLTRDHDRVEVEHFRPDQPNEGFIRTSLGYLLAHRLPVLRRRLTGDTALLDFTNLEEFRDLGGTDYLLFLIGFGPGSNNGIICSWLCDRPSGFTDAEIAQLQRITRELAIALKARFERNIAQNVATAYLGRHAGQAVLSGAIRRGDGQKITAALWYCDLRQSTTLADRLPVEAFLELLGRYFEMTAASVLDHGGEVVSLIGDAVLAIFRVEGAPAEACGRAFAAAQDARRRLAAAPAGAAGIGLDFGIALHLGSMIYGNVGVADRLQFTLVGSAVNEVVRVQDLTKQLRQPVIATAPFAEAAGGHWRPLGEHLLRGFETPTPILVPAS